MNFAHCCMTGGGLAVDITGLRVARMPHVCEATATQSNDSRVVLIGLSWSRTTLCRPT